MKRSRSKLRSLPSVVRAVRALQKKGKKVVFTNGCFDILHVGHVRYLAQARSLGDALVIGVNRDASVARLKGPGRPVVKERERAEVLSALSSVDLLVFFGEPTPLKLIQAIKPDFLVKGGDWKKKDIVGWDTVERYGGKVRSLQFVKGFSSTGLIEKLKAL